MNGHADGDATGTAPRDGRDPAGPQRPPTERMRLSDADRDKIIDQLAQRYAEGRLSHDTFTIRVDAALKARHDEDIAVLLADLPPQQRPGASLISRCQRGWRAIASAAPRALRPAPAPVLMFPSGTRPRFTIGRDEACDMVLPHPTVSRWHAGLKRDGGGWMIDDLGSMNGTRVNGWRVREWVPVRDGDLVTFGDITFVVGLG
jgi:hypothetical protein